MTNPRVVFFGTPSFVECVLQALEENYQVVGVITSLNSPVETSYRSYIFDPHKHHGEWSSLDKIILNGDLDRDLAKKLLDLNPDLFIIAAFGKIIPEFLLNIPKSGSLNIHPSPLPKYRGPSPIQATLLNGDKETGVTVMKIDEKMDHGPILISKNFSISDDDNLETLSNKLFQEGTKLLIEVISDFLEGKLTPKEQDHSKATFCKLVKKENGFFEIDNPPSKEQLSRMIRAYYPWPGVWTKWKGKIVKFFPNHVVQMEGKKPSLLADFLNGYPDFPLKSL